VTSAVNEPEKSQGNIPVHAIVLAAGQSRRMGGTNKLLVQLDGTALVRHVVEAAGASRVCGITVVSGFQAQGVVDALKGLDVDYCHNPDFADGLASSLRRGIKSVPHNCAGAIILLGDMPRITSAMINGMLDEFEHAQHRAIIQATGNGALGNPVVWPAEYFEALKQVSGDVGGRHLIAENAEKIITVELGEAACLDIDTPEMLRRLKQR